MKGKDNQDQKRGEDGSESGPEDDRLKEFEKENYKYVEDKGDPSKIQTAEQIAERRIVTIKRKIQPKPVDSNDKNVQPAAAFNAKPGKPEGHLTFAASFSQLTKSQSAAAGGK